MKRFLFIIISLLIFIYLYFNTNFIKEVSFNDEIIYLYVGEESLIDYKVIYNKHVITNFYFESENNEVVKIIDNKVIGNNPGETVIKFKYENEVYAKTKVVVSDLYSKYTINNEKEPLLCNKYSDKENTLLDSILEYKIKKAGYNTRAGVVEAARFLTLSFPYQINYFYENGRLINHNGDRNYVDGEGRYYHKGLYLSSSKFKDITSSYKGPSIWGCNLYSFITKTTTPNGIDCSGFVTWAILNGGFDIGDVGAGDTQYDDDLSDVGNRVNINDINFENVKVGDLIGRDGHIAIIIGIDNDTYYIAESLDYSLHVLTIDKNVLNNEWEYIIEMGSIYGYDGNITYMW